MIGWPLIATLFLKTVIKQKNKGDKHRNNCQHNNKGVIMSFAGLRRRRRRRENVYVHSVYQASGRGWTGRRRRSAWKWYPKYKRSRQKPHFTGPTLLLSVIIITRLNFIFIPVCSPISYLRSSNLKSSNVTFVISVFVKSFFFSWNPSLILPSQIPLSLSLSLYIYIYIYIYI